MTFFGAYRGPAWEHAAPAADGRGAHGVRIRPMRTRTARRTRRSRGHARAGRRARAHDDHGGGHGHGPWHGPHESPRPMTLPLMALAVGAVVAGFVGIPAALGGGNAIEHFLEPSFTAHAAAGAASGRRGGTGVRAAGGPGARAEGEEHDASRGVELGLMALLGADRGRRHRPRVAGSTSTSPEISERLAERFAGAHRTAVEQVLRRRAVQRDGHRRHDGSGRGLWTFDRNVVDGAVNGTGWLTVVSSWLSGLTDRTVVDGAGEPGRAGSSRSRATGSAGSRPAWCRTTRC